MTKPVVLLSKSAFTITPSCVSILFSLIFTVTSLRYSLGFSVEFLDNDVLLLNTLSIANLL